MIETPRHTIGLTVQGKQLYGWTTYNIETSINGGAGTFALTIAFTKERLLMLVPDRVVTVTIDNIPIITGPIDIRNMSEGEDSISINGRDWCGRLVSESAPGFAFAGLDIEALVSKLAAPWFKVVAGDNARNRKVQLGKGHKAKPSSRPKRRHRTHRVTRVEPGQTRWQIIQEVCNQARLLAWSSGDGRELIVSDPDYDQAVQFRFFQPAAASLRIRESTVKGLGVRDSVADRYSQIILVGSGAGTDANYGVSVSARFAEAKNNTTIDGTGKDFFYPKRLVMQRDVASQADALNEVNFEMAKRDTEGHQVTVLAAGHGQLFEGSTSATIFCPDTIASVEDERIGLAGKYLVTACSYSSGRGAGEETRLTLVKKGAALAI
jgi:prophage tail gpP-like protein